MKDQRRWFGSLTCILTIGVSAPADAREGREVESLLPVSPGGLARALTVASECPTFSWAAAGPHAAASELAVDLIPAEGEGEPRPILRVKVPAGALSWTPGVEQCLPVGRYIWMVRASDAEAEWSPPRRFDVAGARADVELERAIERVLERWVAEGRELPRSDRELAAAALDTPTQRPGDRTVPSGGSSKSSFIADEAAFPFPDCTGDPLFDDVSNAHPLCKWIEQSYADGIAGDCDPDAGLQFCPDNSVTRGQLAVYVERAMRGTATWDVTSDLLDGIDSTAFALLAGRAGGQTVRGGTASGDDLILDSTANATKGDVHLNPSGGNVGIGGSLDVGASLDVQSSIRVNPQLVPPLACSVGTSGNLYFDSNQAIFCYCDGTNWVAIHDSATLCS